MMRHRNIFVTVMVVSLTMLSCGSLVLAAPKGLDCRGPCVGTDEIEDQAVTAAKLAPGLLVGWDLENVVTVAKSGGDFTSVVDALAAIGTALPAATASDPYVVLIAPGTYDLGSSPVLLKSFVDIVGSGSGTTILEGAVASTGGGITNGLLLGADSVTLRDLTIKNQSDQASSAVFNSAAKLTLRHVELIAAGGGVGSKIGLWNQGGGIVEMRHVRSMGSGPASSVGFCAGMLVRSAEAIVFESEVIGDGCGISLGIVVDDGGVARIAGSDVAGRNASINAISISVDSQTAGEHSEMSIYNSRLSGTVFYGIDGSAGSSAARIASTQIDGDIVEDATETLVCVNAYDENFAALGTDCEP